MASRPEDSFLRESFLRDSWAPHSLQFCPEFAPHSDDGSQDQERQTGGQQNFPSYFHELVEAVTRERATIPDVEVHEPGNFGREPENVVHANADGREEQNQTDESENRAESGSPYGLTFESRGLG